MCTISNVGDGWRDSFPNRYPNFTPSDYTGFVPQVSRAEFDALKNEMSELKELLKAAKKFDEATGQPNCETADKVRLIKEIAALVGVDMADVFDK